MVTVEKCSSFALLGDVTSASHLDVVHLFPLQRSCLLKVARLREGVLIVEI